MNNLWNKIKLFAVGLVVILFTVAVSVSSCNTKKAGSDDSGQKAKEKTEHPSGDSHEHPTDHEHPAGEEHPADSVEHPTDGGGEHPSN